MHEMTRLTNGADRFCQCAAIATEGLSVFSPASIAKHVDENTAGILAGAATNRVCRFDFYSTMARYGTDEPTFPGEPAGDA